MINNEIKYLESVLLLFFEGAVSPEELSDIVEEVSNAIELDEEQTKALETNMHTYTVSLQIIFTKYESVEESPRAMLSEIKVAKELYLKSLKKDIGIKKFKAYEGFTEKVQLELLGEVVSLRLLYLQEPISITDNQFTLLKPIMAKAMRDSMSTLMKFVDKPINSINMIKVSKSLMSIKKTMNNIISKILSREQTLEWNILKEDVKKELTLELVQQ